MRGMGIADLDGDGRRELCVITSRGFLIVLTNTCEKLWARRWPSEPLALAASAASEGRPGRVVVDCREGGVFALDSSGAFAGQQRGEGAVVEMARLDDTRAVTADEQDRLSAWQVR